MKTVQRLACELEDRDLNKIWIKCYRWYSRFSLTGKTPTTQVERQHKQAKGRRQR